MKGPTQRVRATASWRCMQLRQHNRLKNRVPCTRLMVNTMISAHMYSLTLWYSGSTLRRSAMLVRLFTAVGGAGSTRDEWRGGAVGHVG